MFLQIWLWQHCGAFLLLVLLSMLPAARLELTTSATQPAPPPAPPKPLAAGYNVHNNFDPVLAASYMDELLSNPITARTRLCGPNFTRRSRFAVVYMCFARPEMIRRSLPSVLWSDGIEDLDVFVSQDGGSEYLVDQDVRIPSSTRLVYIRHPFNLCTGVHHYFVKNFMFDVLGYEGLMIVEEDNVLHPQALQLLSRMIEMSVDRPDIGIVSIRDLDNSAFLDATTLAEGLQTLPGTSGHLWVFGLHRSRYERVRSYLKDYYDTIKGYTYSRAHAPPLADRIKALLESKGFPGGSALSQDRYFINSLAHFGFTSRLQTLYRFMEPIGYLGLHYRGGENAFFAFFGHGMFNGRIRPQEAFDATADAAGLKLLRASVTAALNSVWQEYYFRDAPESLVNHTYNGVLNGKLNGAPAIIGMRRRGEEHLAKTNATVAASVSNLLGR